MASSKPKIIYFPVRGRAEPIRMALAAAGIEFESEASPPPAELKADLDHYHFGQVPRYIDDEVDLCQSHAILCHLGRKHNLYGSNLAEQAAVDEIMDGVTDLGRQVSMKCVMKQDDEESKEAYWRDHVHPDSLTAPATRGAHMGFLSRLLAKSSSGFFLQSGLSIADISAAIVLEMHIFLFGDRVKEEWPDLHDLYERVMAVEGIAAYKKSEQYLPKFSPALPGPPPPPKDV